MNNVGKRLQLPPYLVEPHWLERHLDHPDLRVFDCTVIAGLNPDPEEAERFPFAFKSGSRNFETEHIPGAGFIDLLDELSDKSSPLPFMMPSEDRFTNAMFKYGIDDNTRVVLYSTSEAMWAARVWWMLRAFGFDDAVLLNGGWVKWTEEGRPVSSKPCRYLPGQFTTRRRPELFAGKEEVLKEIGKNGCRIISALPAAIHAGTGGPKFGRKGRIAGSVNVPFASLHDPDTNDYLPVGKLREIFNGVQVSDGDRIITYCGSGIAASSGAFALTLLGYDNVAVYDASMSEWGNDLSLPMETD